MTDSSGSDAELPAGVWLGIDVGSVRIGVARSDPRGMLAVPVATLPADPRRHSDLDQLCALIDEHDAVGVVVGLPRTLANREGPAVRAAREFGARMKARIAPIPVRYVDERLTTVVAQRNLTSSGVRGKAKRAVVDQAAAVEILQLFLDSARPKPAHESGVHDTGTSEHSSEPGKRTD